MTPTNIQLIVREIVARCPTPPKRRGGYGEWRDYAPQVAALIETHQWGVTPAVRAVIDHHRLTSPAAYPGIRAAYYTLVRRTKQTHPTP
jgi:hypothetical protein